MNYILINAHNYAQRSAVCACCRRVAVARVFALVVRGRDMMLFVYSRVGKNRDTTRGPPAGAGAGRGASHKTASLVTQLSRHGAAIAYTDLLAVVYFDYLLAF